MELTALTDEGLSQHLNDVINEQERRAELARIPGELRERAARFRELGGDPAELTLEPPAPTT